MKIHQEIIIAANADEISALFWNIKAWNNIWMPIQTIEMLYEDDNHQEMIMKVDRDGKMESNRTIRFRHHVSGEIAFFSPTPPPMMSYHKGFWRFVANGKQTKIISERDYSLTRIVSESEHEFSGRQQVFSQGFTQRLLNILTSFKTTLESKE